MIVRGAKNRVTLFSLLKNRLYRKSVPRFPGEFSRLFQAVAKLREHDSSLLPALKPIHGLPGQMVLLEFHDPGLAIYSGLEIIVFDDERFLYYRLPGALPNGEGWVAPGRYLIRFNAFRDRREVFLVLEKGDQLSFRLIAQALGRPPQPGRYVRLEAHELDYSWITGELRSLVLRWLGSVAVPASPAQRTQLVALASACAPLDDPLSQAARSLTSRIDLSNS